MRSTRFYAIPYLTEEQPAKQDGADVRANFLAGLMLLGLLSLSLLGLATLVGLVGYGIHLILA
jgi:hypothetical protein